MIEKVVVAVTTPFHRLAEPPTAMTGYPQASGSFFCSTSTQDADERDDTDSMLQDATFHDIPPYCGLGRSGAVGRVSYRGVGAEEGKVPR